MAIDEVLEGLDEHLKDCMEAFDAPGLAVVALKDNKVVYSKGLGYRDVDKKLEMTTSTIHPIASCTKSFTSTAIAMLVDEGKLEWDTPIREFIPKFKMKDPVATERVTIVDMLSHRTGLPRHDFVWVNDDFTYDQILERLPYLDLSKDIRTTLQYCNLMYLAASVIIEELSGMSYNDFIVKRIFKPLKMNNSNLTIRTMRETPDYATPYKIDYADENLNYKECDYIEHDDAAGAGDINASIDDMGKWLRFHLNKGKVGKKQLVSADNLRRTHDSVMIISMTMGLDYWVPNQKWFRMDSYALGWAGVMYRGNRVVRHGGGIDGSTSLMGFIPDEGVGVMAIVNKSDCGITGAVLYHLFDRFLGLEPVDYNEIYTRIDAEIIKGIQESGEKSQGIRIKDTKPTRPIEEYIGRYHHPGYGEVKFHLLNDELTFKMGSVDYPMTHFHYDTFQYDIKRFDVKGLLTFHADDGGEITEFSAKLEQLTPPITFTRLPDEHMREREFLEPLIGKYEAMGIVLEIEIRGDDTITFKFPGQQPTELEPVRGVMFNAKGGSFSLKFVKDKSGIISEFLYIDPMQVIPAKRIE